MVKVIAKKCRLCRSAGKKLFLKGERCLRKCPIDKKGAVPPGSHGTKRRRRRLSDFGIRLKETVKLKKIFSISERQTRKYFKEAMRAKESTSQALLQILESRLDNLVFRLGLAPSRRLARQLVSHKHIMVDGKVVNIPSFLVKPGQVISLTSKGAEIIEVKKKLGEKDISLPAWLERKAGVGKLLRLPEIKEMEADIDEHLIVEHYSRK